jgi:hypothetical protein
MTEEIREDEIAEISEGSIAESDEQTRREYEEGVPVTLYSDVPEEVTE